MYVGNKSGNDDPQLTFPVPVFDVLFALFSRTPFEEMVNDHQKGSPVTQLVGFAWTIAGLAGV